jgi:hypothetical protein
VYIRSYTVTYQPVGDFPDLDPYLEVRLLDSRGIPPCPPGSTSCSATTYDQLKFMDVAKKVEYLTRGGDPFTVASYNIQYTFHGENNFGEEFTFEGATNFTVANYDYCN